MTHADFGDEIYDHASDLAKTALAKVPEFEDKEYNLTRVHF